MRAQYASILLVSALLSVSAQMGAEQNYKRISVCKILAQPNTKDLQYVVVDADLANARPHGVVLIDQHCPGKGLLLDFPPTGDETIANLEKSIRHDDIPLESTGTFYGKIKRDAATKRFVLSLRSVQSLQPKH